MIPSKGLNSLWSPVCIAWLSVSQEEELGSEAAVPTLGFSYSPGPATNNIIVDTESMLPQLLCCWMEFIILDASPCH